MSSYLAAVAVIFPFAGGAVETGLGIDGGIGIDLLLKVCETGAPIIGFRAKGKLIVLVTCAPAEVMMSPS